MSGSSGGLYYCGTLISFDIVSSPVNKQVLLHPEALGASVAVEAVVVSPELRFGLVALALALGKLRQLVLGCAERPRLLPDARCVDHKAVL